MIEKRYLTNPLPLEYPLYFLLSLLKDIHKDINIVHGFPFELQKPKQRENIFFKESKTIAKT